MHAVAETLVGDFGEDSAKAELEAVKKAHVDNQRKIDNAVNTIVEGVDIPELRDKLSQLREENERLETQILKLQFEQLEMSVEDLEEFIRHRLSLDDDEVLLGGLLRTVYLFEDEGVAVMNFEGRETELAEVKFAVQDKGLSSIGMAGPAGFEPT